MKLSFKGGNQFKYRIAPHEGMKEEYPAPYYKFKNEKVATAFFYESMGHEIKSIPKSIVYE